MLRLSKKLCQAFSLLIAFLILCSGLVRDKITLFSPTMWLKPFFQVTLSQWKETWIASSLLLALLGKPLPRPRFSDRDGKDGAFSSTLNLEKDSLSNFKETPPPFQDSVASLI